jgi:ribosomal protein S18 acetylase RimI-like enzyme
VVRHHTEAGPTDVLGELTGLDDEWLAVRTEAGEERRIARTDVIAAKPVGPRPARYSEIITLERVADRAWPAPDVERLGDWLLRAADGFTNRANSALPLGEPGCSLDEAVTTCARFYAERGLPPKITVPLPVRRDVARHLEAAGWIAQPTVLVQTAPVAPLAPLAAVSSGLVTVHEQPPPGFLAVVAARKAVLPAAADHVLTAVEAVRFAVAHDLSGTVIGTSRGAAVDGWLHISLVEVAPAARRQGLARAMSAALASWAQGCGATRAVLQVEQQNTPAIRLYEGLGFRTHHTYVTYRAPATPSSE